MPEGFDCAGRRMSRSQRIVTRLMRGRADEIEAESREWIVSCPACEWETSIWELGGVRYGARSAGKRMRLECGGCGQKSWMPVERRASA